MKSKLQTALFGDAFQSAKTNKKQFLEKMDSLIPWQDWVSIIDPIYYEGKERKKRAESTKSTVAEVRKRSWSLMTG